MVTRRSIHEGDGVSAGAGGIKAQPEGRPQATSQYIRCSQAREAERVLNLNRSDTNNGVRTLRFGLRYSFPSISRSLGQVKYPQRAGLFIFLDENIICSTLAGYKELLCKQTTADFGDLLRIPQIPAGGHPGIVSAHRLFAYHRNFILLAHRQTAAMLRLTTARFIRQRLRKLERHQDAMHDEKLTNYFETHHKSTTRYPPFPIYFL